MNTTPQVKTMRLRYDGTCSGCGRTVSAGESAHYLRVAKAVRCLPCGPEGEAAARAETQREPPETLRPLDRWSLRRRSRMSTLSKVNCREAACVTTAAAGYAAAAMRCSHPPARRSCVSSA